MAFATRMEPQRTIREVMGRGSWVREQLREHDVHPNPAEWQGRPGVEVAASLLASLGEVEMVDGSQAAERRAAIISRCARVVGEVTIPPASAEMA